MSSFLMSFLDLPFFVIYLEVTYKRVNMQGDILAESQTVAVSVQWAGPGAVVLVTCGVWVSAHTRARLCLCQPLLSAVGPGDGSGQQCEPVFQAGRYG